MHICETAISNAVEQLLSHRLTVIHKQLVAYRLPAPAAVSPLFPANWNSNR